MRCPKCKTHNHDKAKFCINCGVSLCSANLPLHSDKLKYIIITVICLFFLLLVVVFFYRSSKQDRYPKRLSDEIAPQSPKAKSEIKSLDSKQPHTFAGAESTVYTINKNKNGHRTFPDNSREATLNKALSVQNTNPLMSLALISKGICIPSSLSGNNIPYDIRTENIIKVMQNLILTLSNKGYDKELEEILTPEVLRKTGNIKIFVDTVHIISDNHGFGSAIQFVEKTRLDFVYPNSAAESKIYNLIVHLYLQWLTEQMNDNNIDSAKSIFDFAEAQFPYNPDIHIAGIQIALKQGNWERAEFLLIEINYPESLSDKVELLRNQISALKGQEGKIVIKFTPGSKHIPVHAVLNGKIKQSFLVDTGASFVTIPTSTIRALGIRINKNAPIINVATAGGVKTAREIILQSITLGRCSVNNIKALVLDIPGQPNLGLLGLNFLHYFHLEINNKKGVLLLKPR